MDQVQLWLFHKFILCFCTVTAFWVVAEMWTLRGARVSVSTFQRENFFGYKLAPALDGLSFLTSLDFINLLKFVAGNLFRVDGDRGLVERLPRSVQVFVCLDSLTFYCQVVTVLQELVNLAPFVLDDGSIVTGEIFVLLTRGHCLICCRH
jgi:hypothetical protein